MEKVVRVWFAPSRFLLAGFGTGATFQLPPGFIEVWVLHQTGECDALFDLVQFGSHCQRLHTLSSNIFQQ